MGSPITVVLRLPKLYLERMLCQTVSLKAGDGIFIPAGEEHKHLLHVLGERIRVVLVEESDAQ
jgi:quercetin dioxygenase-like cupin family protein